MNTKSLKTRNILLTESGTKNVETVRSMNCPESLISVRTQLQNPVPAYS